MSHQTPGPLRAVIAFVSAGWLGLSAAPAHACYDEPLLGSVCWMAAPFCPENYAPANGQLLRIAENDQLFSLFGNKFGGDGVLTFGLPDLRARSPVAPGKPATDDQLSPSTVFIGQQRGAETQTLAMAQMPAHSHKATFVGQTTPVSIAPKLQVVAANPTTATSMAPSSGTPYLAGTPSAGPNTRKMWLAAQGASTTAVGGLTFTLAPLPPNAGGPAVANGYAGGTGTAGHPNTPINTISPQLTMTACIAVRGMYPIPNN